MAIREALFPWRRLFRLFIWSKLVMLAAGLAPEAVTLSWNANPEPDVLGYRVFYGEVSASPTIINTGRNTSVLITNLTPGKRYFFYVTAYNTAGLESDPSAKIEYTQPGSVAPVPVSAEFLYADAESKGDWRGIYGAEGGAGAYSDFLVPSYLQINANYNYSVRWTPSTTDRRPLHKRLTSARIGGVWQNTNGPMYLYLNLTDGKRHRVSFYFIDYDFSGRVQKLEFYNRNNKQLLTSTVISNFQGGVYLNWHLQGNITVKIIPMTDPRVAISGIFFDPEVIKNTPAHLISIDRTSGGKWKGRYGLDGHAIANVSTNLPTSYELNLEDAASWTWLSSTTDISALESPFGSGRSATTWYAQNFTIHLQCPETAYNKVSFYFVDFDAGGRRQQVDIFDGQTGHLLDTTELSNFRDGLWLNFAIKGNVVIRLSSLSGYNAVLSGIMVKAEEIRI